MSGGGSADEIDFVVGPEGDAFNHEIWERDLVDGLRELRLCLEAVVAGRYEAGTRTYEMRFLWWRWKDAEFRGTFHTDEGDITFAHHSVRANEHQPYRAFAEY